jgi:2,4-dienoyl-CoA reductase-like NADH-dependent reductase (Old Yellow Enzyme family)
LVIAESTIVAQRAGGLARKSGIWSDKQIAGWKPVRRHPLFSSLSN